MLSDFWFNIIVAIIASIFANLLTPLVRGTLITALARVTRLVNVFGAWGRRKALSISERELKLLTDFRSNPLNLILTIGYHLAFNIFLLWLLVLGFAFAFMFGYLEHPRVYVAFFAFLGVSTSSFVSVMAILSMIEKLQTFDKFKIRAEKRIALLRKSQS